MLLTAGVASFHPTTGRNPAPEACSFLNMTQNTSPEN
jgi:hypothetical protein